VTMGLDLRTRLRGSAMGPNGADCLCGHPEHTSGRTHVYCMCPSYEPDLGLGANEDPGGRFAREGAAS